MRNQDQRSRSYEDWHHIYRPSHADFAYDAKYGIRAWQGGGRSSARETVGVSALARSRMVLAQRFPELRIVAWVEQVHQIAQRSPNRLQLRLSRLTPTRLAAQNQIPPSRWPRLF